MWTEAAILCFILAVITDFVELSTSGFETRESLLGSSSRSHEQDKASLGYLDKAMFESWIPWKKYTTRPSIELYGVNQFACKEDDLTYSIYFLKEGSSYSVLLDKSKTKVIGVILRYQLCPFRTPNPEGNDGYLTAEVKLDKDKAETILPGTTLANLLQQFSGEKSLLPYTRPAIIAKKASPHSTGPSNHL